MLIELPDEYRLYETSSRNAEPLVAKKDGTITRQSMGGTKFVTRYVKETDPPTIEVGTKNIQDLCIKAYVKPASEPELKVIAERAEQKNSIVLTRRNEDGRTVGSIIVNRSGATLTCRDKLGEMIYQLAEIDTSLLPAIVSRYLDIFNEDRDDIAARLCKIK